MNSRRKFAAAVTLLEQERFTMSDNWTDRIVLKRDGRGRVSVVCSKFGGHPDTGRRRWFDVDRAENLRSPREIRKALDDAATLMDVTLEWVDAVPLVAKVDWVTAAVIASEIELDLPPLPSADEMLGQRSLRALGSVEIGVEWGYDMHELKMPFERWVRILNGEPYRKDKRYPYEGKLYMGGWRFDKGKLRVTIDDEGEGWIGAATDVDIVRGPQVDGADIAELARRSASTDGEARV